jgi:hypothetical protein
MTEPDSSSKTIDADLRAQVVDDPLHALAQITELRRVLQQHEREAVFRALKQHSWREVGEALGVSKQAAFQRFGRDWVHVAQATLPASKLEKTIKDRLDG